MDGWTDRQTDRQIDRQTDRQTPGGSSTVHIYTNNTQSNAINLGRVRAVPHLCELYPGIFLTTEEKAWKNLS